MTLDQAQSLFSVAPTARTASQLLTTGTEYFHDGMIEDTTFTTEVILPVALWLFRQVGVGS